MLERMWQRIGGLAVAAMLLSACGQSPTATGGNKGLDVPDDDAPARGGITQFYTKNVMYRVDDDVQVGMPDLNADIVVKRPNQAFVPANLNDFVVNIHTGNLVIDDASMTGIFNKYVFNYEGSPLSDLKVTNKEGRVALSGTLRKGLPIPFSMEGTLQPDGEGHLVLKPENVKSAGIPVKGIMDVIGLEMASLINSKAAGVKIDGNNIVIYPNKLLPPPAINCYAVGAKIEPGRVIMMLDDKVRRPNPELPEPNAKNFLLMWGGNILINNHLVMDAKIMQIDTTPSDPMYYYMPLYREQLAAGATIGDRGVTIAYVPDVRSTKQEFTRYRPNF